MANKHPSQKRYPPELRKRAVRTVQQAIAEAGGERFGVVTRVARQLGVGTESVRNWVREPERDAGTGPGPSAEERAGASPSWSGRTASSGVPTRSLTPIIHAT